MTTATKKIKRSSNVRLKKRCNLLSENNREMAVSASHTAKKIKRLMERTKCLNDELREFPELNITTARLREEHSGLLLNLR